MAKAQSNPSAMKALLQEAAVRELTKTAIRVQSQARVNCPVDNGTLRRSISFVIEGSTPATVHARVGSNVEYAPYVETGTGIYGPKGRRIVPKPPNRFLRFIPKGAKGFIFVKSVKGMRGTHFLERALRSVVR